MRQQRVERHLLLGWDEPPDLVEKRSPRRTVHDRDHTIHQPLHVLRLKTIEVSIEPPHVGMNMTESTREVRLYVATFPRASGAIERVNERTSERASDLFSL